MNQSHKASWSGGVKKEKDPLITRSFYLIAPHHDYHYLNYYYDFPHPNLPGRPEQEPQQKLTCVPRESIIKSASSTSVEVELQQQFGSQIYREASSFLAILGQGYQILTAHHCFRFTGVLLLSHEWSVARS